MIFENTWQGETVLHEAFIDDNADVSIREVTLGGDPIEDLFLTTLVSVLVMMNSQKYVMTYIRHLWVLCCSNDGDSIMKIKETLINTLVDTMSMEDLQQYVANDMADFLYHCRESEVIKNEFLIKLEHTTDEQFFNKFVKQIEGKIK